VDLRSRRIPEDPHERLTWLEQWAAEQHEGLGDRDPLRARLRLKIGTMIEQQLERLDPIFDRGLNTSRDEFLPRPGGPGIMYVAAPTPWHVLPRALRKVGASDHDVFVELGCGKGRVVHQAAKWPLKRVIGVEILPEVADFARGLVAAHRRKYRCQRLEIVTGDIAEFPVPDDLTVAYHAYESGEDTMHAVLGNLIESIDSRPRRVRLICYRPNRGVAQVLATGRFQRLPDSSFGGTTIFESCG
jgi:SAM-dependent methyltransferase